MNRIYLSLLVFLLSINTWAAKVGEYNDSILNKVEKLQLKVDSLKIVTLELNSRISEETSTEILTKANIYLLLISLILSIVIVWFFFLFFKKKWSRDRIIEEVINSSRMRQFIELQSNKSIGQTPSNNSIVRQVIDQIKTDEKYQAMVNYQIQLSKEDSKQPIPPQQTVNESITQTITKYFYSIEPRSGGNFFYVDKTTTEFVETESIYYFEKQDENSALYRVVDDNPTMKRAITYKAELLDIACDSLNGTQIPQKIVTEKPGAVKKEGDRWVIVTKAKIKFI